MKIIKQKLEKTIVVETKILELRPDKGAGYARWNDSRGCMEFSWDKTFVIATEFRWQNWFENETAEYTSELLKNLLAIMPK